MESIIVNLPETFKIHTLDNQVMEVTGKLINESEYLMETFEMYGAPLDNVMFIPVHSAGLKMTLKFLELFDLSESYDPELDEEVFKQANRPAMKFYDHLSEVDRTGMEFVIDCLQCDRLIDFIYLCVSDALKGKKAYKYCKWLSSEVDSTDEEDEEEETLKSHEEDVFDNGIKNIRLTTYDNEKVGCQCKHCFNCGVQNG
uniref:Skp1_POZ domain-containing protein n=1 Tax=Panagrellus redivivus TaxID=6233 RepID=A0A7E4W8I3_PANRE